jgi:hypothetical protein
MIPSTIRLLDRPPRVCMSGITTCSEAFRRRKMFGCPGFIFWNLNLGSNMLSGQLPMELGTLSMLQHLDLGQNEFSGSMLSLQNLTALQACRLDGNKFTGLLPSEIGLWSDLEIFDASNNLLVGEVPSEIGSLVVNASLSSFNISGNLFSGTLPMEFCQRNDNFSLYFDCSPSSGICGCDCICSQQQQP